MKDKKGVIIAISAPSGAGKTTIVKQILSTFNNVIFSVSATTRKKRANEVEGKDYFFISEEEFKKKIENDEFVEWEKVYDYYYGTFKSFIEENIKKGISVLLEIDVKGALTLKDIYPESVLVFIVPPSFDELVKRLKNRKTESEKDFQKRIERAKMELREKDKFDYLVVNNDLNKAILDVKEIVNKIINKE